MDKEQKRSNEYLFNVIVNTNRNKFSFIFFFIFKTKVLEFFRIVKNILITFVEFHG